MSFLAAILRGQTPTFVGVVHKSKAKVVCIDDEYQDERCNASRDRDEVQKKAKGGQYELLGCVADGDAEGSPNVAESLLHVKRKFFPGKDGFCLFGEERVNGRHQNVDNRAADENE